MSFVLFKQLTMDLFPKSLAFEDGFDPIEPSQELPPFEETRAEMNDKENDNGNCPGTKDIENENVNENAYSPGNGSEPDMDDASFAATRALAAKLVEIEGRVAILEELTINSIGEPLKSKENVGRDCITASQFKYLVHQAMLAGANNGLGCSKIFLRQYLKKNNGIQDNGYQRRRLNALLTKKVAQGLYVLVNDLYSIADCR